jgi:HEAT repeat protein
MSEGDRDVWTEACASFRRVCEDDDLLRLRAARGDADRDTRARVVGTLGRIRDDTVIPDLYEALRDPDVEVRVLAAGGLRDLGEVLSDATLGDLAISVRSAPDRRTRAAAAEMLALADVLESARLGLPNAARLRLIAFTLGQLGQREDALETLREARAVFPDDAQLCCDLCDCALAAGRVEEAIEAGACAVALAPGDVGIAFSRAVALVVRDGDSALGQIQSVVDRARSTLIEHEARQFAHSQLGTFADLAKVWPDRRSLIDQALELVRMLDPTA